MAAVGSVAHEQLVKDISADENNEYQDYTSSDDDELDEQLPAPRITIADLIHKSSVKSTFDDHEPNFYPNDCIDRLITPDTIRNALRPENKNGGVRSDPRLDRLVTWIHCHARKVFALTLQFDTKQEDLQNTMKYFSSRKHSFDDKNLPIAPPSAQTENPINAFTQAFKNIWDRDRFYETQWQFLAPIFSKSQYWYNLDRKSIMPIVSKDGQREDGGFSHVFKVRIHEAHDPDGFKEVAVKQIKLSVRRGDENVKAKLEEEWGREAHSLERVNELGHPHIIKCYAAIRRGDNRYFMFPWADGGSLRDYWQASPEQKPRPAIIRQAVRQLCGLADALDSLHNLGSSMADIQENLEPSVPVPELRVQGERLEDQDHFNDLHIRHGDIKPENILRFTTTDDPEGLGTLKLADMGLAKQHIMATEERKNMTSTRYGTIRYEAPEARTELTRARSRLYDIWSLGCVTVEYIIWILYGYTSLQRFYSHFEDQPSPFFDTVQEHTIDGGQHQKPVVHRVVNHWINHIEATDPECKDIETSALKDLLVIVKTKMLVVSLDPRRNTNIFGGGGANLEPLEPGQTRIFRATAAQLRDALETIRNKLDDETYVFTGTARDKAQPPAGPPGSAVSSSLTTPGGNRQRQAVPRPRTSTTEVPHAINEPKAITNRDYDLPPLKDWEFPVDNGFAERVLAQLGAEAFKPVDCTPAKLCDRCMNINFWVGNFTLEDKRSKLLQRARVCQFCAMLLEICQKLDSPERVRFDRKESTIQLSDIHERAVLSIVRSPGLQTPTGINIQLGFPEPPMTNASEFYHLLNLWVDDCNQNHPECVHQKPTYLPTRLVDVGTDERPILRLLETATDSISGGRYVALSHPWGDRNKHPPFTTTRANIAQFKQEIILEALPATLKDAVHVTRQLGVPYLWVDTLCIIQGDDGDFGSESKRMEDVYSGAFCVIAASCASGTHDGFLQSKPRRDYLTFQRGTEKPFYMCTPIDDFSGDVLQSYLAKRGWVFQERALARRTIFFAENQAYFECGHGVRCQTLSKMHNNLADFLGDPNFPNKGMRSPRGVKIRYFQDLYRQYSRLDFSRNSDRPFAIEGLENRLRKAYGTSGGWGIFDDGPGNGLFHRSLLWCRGDELIEGHTSLERIRFPEQYALVAPSWSWMAYCGAIDYFDPPFQKMEWEKRDIEAPWTRPATADGATLQSGLGTAALEIIAKVRNFDISKSRSAEVKIVFDLESGQPDRGSGQCVVIARGYETTTNSLSEAKEVIDKQKTFYVLLVTERQKGMVDENGRRVYQRIGVAYLLGKHITLSDDGVEASIV